MKTTQNITKLLLATILAFALTACSDKSEAETNATTDANVAVEQNTRQSGADDNASTTPTVTLKSLTLGLSKTKLNKDENTTTSLQATYSNNSNKTLTNNIEWIVSPSDAVQISNGTLKAKKDTKVTVQAKVCTILSNQVTLNITWVVNGHVLPPVPDKALNDSTLLGIDSNNNGVRDDVERWIYTNYEDKHPIHIDIGMQVARGYKLVLESPERAKEIHKKVSAALSCEAYYQIYAQYLNEPLLVSKDIVTKYFRKSIYFNTIKRKNAYTQYDTLLSGSTYTLPKIEEKKLLCDFDINKYEE